MMVPPSWALASSAVHAAVRTLVADGVPPPFSEIVGTPYYLAPEAYYQNYDQKVDLWAAGIVLHMLLTRRPLIEADSLQDAVNVLRPGFDPKPLLNKLAGAADSSASTPPKVSEKALALLKGLLEPQPVLRIGASDAVDLCKEWAVHTFDHR